MANDFRYKLYGGATRPDAITGLTTPFSSALMKMYNAAPPDVQRELGLTSGYRSKEVQAQLFNASDRSGRTVAAPGHSRHNFGMAADLYGFGLGGSGPKVSQRTRDWVTANAGNFGLNFPMHYEPWHIQLGKNWAGGQPAATDQTTTGSIPPRAQSTLLGAMLRNESGGRNVANTTQGTTSGQAQGYFQITTGTWHDFGGDKYAPTPMGATYAQQADIASKIPLNRWDKTTLAAMNATGKRIDPNRTLGENLAAGGESFGASSGGGPGGGTATGGAPNPASGGGPGGGTATGEAPSAANNGYGPVVTPGGTDPNVPPATDQLTGADKNKPLGGLMGELARSGGDQMKPMEQLQRPSAGQGASLADVVQQYITAHLRGPQQAAQQPQQPQQIPQQILQALQSSQQGGTGFG